MKRLVIILVVVAVLVAAGGYGFWYVRAAGNSDHAYRTETVTRGDLLATISATGTLEPVDVVDIGAQVAGTIKEFGTDADGKQIDYGSRVTPDMKLIQIDDSLYQAKVKQTRAMVNQNETKVDEAKAKYNQAVAQVGAAKANVQKSEADLQASNAKYDQASRDWDRAQSLRSQNTLSQADYDAYQSTYMSTRAAVAQSKAALAQTTASVADSEANVANAKAAIADAEAAVANAKAILEQDEINLGYTTIKSPVEGVIIDRRVTLGQTVQSSFNTPSLFLVARDLKKMKVWASVNEADIGQIRKGQSVKFTVDAFSGQTFPGNVDLIRLNATMTQNVVTYTVEVITDNSSGKLLPYLTANLRFEVNERKDTLTVSNEALRWKPQPDQIAPDVPKDQGRGGRGKPDGDGAKGPPKGDGANRGVVYVRDGSYVRPVKVKIGLSDGARTEILSGDLEEGTTIVTGDAPLGGPESASNPFLPQIFGRKKTS